MVARARRSDVRCQMDVGVHCYVLDRYSRAQQLPSSHQSSSAKAKGTAVSHGPDHAQESWRGRLVDI